VDQLGTHSIQRDLQNLSLHSSARDRDLDDWLRQSLLRNCVMPPMPPRRRKYNIDVVEEEKPNSKRFKNSIMSSDRYNSRRNSSRIDDDMSGFSQKRCIALFKEFASVSDTDIIEPEGIESFCSALQVAPEDIVMLVLSWKMDAKQMGYFHLKEWLKGLSELQCDSISKLRNKLEYLRSLLNDQSTFKSIYRYSFDFAKDKDQRSIDLETAKGMLQLLLSKRWALYPYFHQFLEQSKYKVLNKDQWCNVLEFSRSISLDLNNYDEDGAWPVLLDEFVDWYRKNKLQN